MRRDLDMQVVKGRELGPPQKVTWGRQHSKSSIGNTNLSGLQIAISGDVLSDDSHTYSTMK